MLLDIIMIFWESVSAQPQPDRYVTAVNIHGRRSACICSSTMPDLEVNATIRYLVKSDCRRLYYITGVKKTSSRCLVNRAISSRPSPLLCCVASVNRLAIMSHYPRYSAADSLGCMERGYDQALMSQLHCTPGTELVAGAAVDITFHADR